MRPSHALCVVGTFALAIGLAAPMSLAQAPATPAAKPPQKPAPAAGPAQTTPGAGPVVVIETSKGTFEFETFPDDAPKTVEHVLALVKKGFYNGLRFHRAVPNFVVGTLIVLLVDFQPLSRDAGLGQH